MVIVLTGVSGAGKTTIGHLLAEELRCSFIDADDFHSPNAIRKMSEGIPLTDVERKPWLEKVRQAMSLLSQKNKTAVIACSALKQSYRDILRSTVSNVRFFHLHGDYDLIYTRLQDRKEHFAKPEMLKSQFAALEKSAKIFQIDIDNTPQNIVRIIQQQMLREEEDSTSTPGVPTYENL